MSLVQVASPDAVRPRHVAMVAIVAFTLLGACLLTTGAGTTAVPDGGRAWRQDSLLRAVVELLNLHSAQPTPLGVEIKSLVFWIGGAAAVLAAGIMIALRPRSEDEIQEGDTVLAEPGAADADAAPTKKHISPLLAAQALAGLLVAWSFIGIAWSDARDIALAGSIDLALCMIWPFAIAFGLGRAAFRYAAYTLVAAGAATSIMAELYFRERNPGLRASYPIGNPLSLAACLVPVLLITFGVMVAQVRDFGNPRRVRRAVIVAVCMAVFVIVTFAFTRADSRGAHVALVAGAGALAFFATRGRIRLSIGLLGIVAAGLAVYVLAAQVREGSPAGRDATVRERVYTWGYAIELIAERKLLGHGQGGYTRKADALAAGEDVLADPEALMPARVAHAHNEWLETWADLGSIGLVLAVGSILLTLAAGASAIGSFPSLIDRWVLIALLACLVALAVEESGNVALRLPGLPPVYYTVLGLIWAAATPPGATPLRALRGHGATRWAAAVLCPALAACAIYLGIGDFRAARAEYEVGRAIEELRWNDAVRLAEEARAGRLDPHRRLVAQERLCETYLHLARVHQVNGLRRIQVAMQSDPPDPQRMVLGQQDVEAAEDYRRRGWQVLRDLVRKSPNFYNSNWVEYEFEQIRAEFARFRGDAEAARQFDQDSANALRRELARRPYDVNMAARLVVASGATLSVEEICQLLARPLRYNPVPAIYDEIAARLLTVPAFMEKFAPVYQKIRDAEPSQALEADPLAPEKLRLAAAVWAQEGESDVAQRSLEHATALYQLLLPRFRYAAAACYAELAERRFFNAPTDPTQAIRDADEAIRLTPQSNEGRQLAAAAKHAKIAMLLAAGDEAGAGALVRELRPDLSDAAVQAALGERYAALSATVMQGESPGEVRPLRGWVDRAIELFPCNVPAWQQKADLAFREADDAECVRCLREARRCGATTDFIHQFVDIALSRRPTSGPLLSYRDELAAELEGRMPPAPATAPASAPASP